jgi:hypothetical protein
MDMKKDNKLPFRELKDAKYIYKKTISSDPEFIKLTKRLLKALEPYNYDGIWSIPDIEQMNIAASTILRKLMTDYDLDQMELLSMILYKTPVLNPVVLSAQLESSEDTGRAVDTLVIYAPINVRVDDFIQQWDRIKEVQKTSRYFKEQLKDDIPDVKLLLAIYKAYNNSEPLEFSEIANRLNNHTLDGYKDNSGRYWAEKDVKDYYGAYVDKIMHFVNP